MSENKGAAEWLRGIIGEYEANDGHSCSAMAKMFGIDCEYETCRGCMIGMLNSAGSMTVSGIRFLEFDRDGTDVDNCFDDGREGAYVLCDNCFDELFRWMWPDRCCSELGGAE